MSDLIGKQICESKVGVKLDNKAVIQSVNNYKYFISQQTF